MTKERASNGYQPPKVQEKGYQPFRPGSDGKPQGGYTPSSTGDNPTNVPTPPGKE